MRSVYGIHANACYKRDGYNFYFFIAIGEHILTREVKVFISTKMDESRKGPRSKMLLREARKR